MDKILALLNEKIVSDSYQKADLTELENAFLETYKPEKRLIIYGSLAPNAPNHHVIEHIKGSWQQGIVRGKLFQYGWGANLGYYAFKHVPTEEQTKINAFVLISDELTDNWEYLDNFEGDGYKRILAKYELNDGQISVGNIYAMTEKEI